MAAQKRRSLLPRRRRHDDEGEGDGSTAGDAPEYASSAGSVTSEEDGDVSNNSADEDHARSASSPTATKQPLPMRASRSEQTFQTTADTEAMLNGLKIEDGANVEELQFDEAVEAENEPKQQPEQRSRSQPTQPKNQRIGSLQSAQPRKGYSQHDDRSKDQQYALPAAPRGRGRGYGTPSNRGNFGSFTHDTSKQWTHDLHETVNQPQPPAAPPPQHSLKQSVQPAAAPTAPNRSFSTTTVLGNVPVNVSIPGVDKRSSAHMVKKHYTLLPQHRPPLRRDKPVRISIPGEHPRYIFPSTDRSFIFIPRAMRPNQQQFRGRGRGSFGGSRRTSVYGGSVYTPSIGMSRRPSIAASATGSGIHTPTGMPMPQYPVGMQKPVVRMPAPGNYPFMPTTQNAEVYLGDHSAIIHSPPATLPMHQPTPQKAVSIDNIESPSMNVPQQQSQQPFHQQIPAHIQDQAQQKMPHIPEGAVYAQPFQPYPAVPQQAYYGMPYPMMQPADGMNYGMGMGGPVLASPQQPGSAGSQGQQQAPSAYESNGMVYYYDPSQQYGYPPIMNPMQPSPYYYPSVQQQMFYQ